MSFLAALFLLQSAAPLAGALPDAVTKARFDACQETAIDDPAAGVEAANAWLIEGGGRFARQCMGFAHARAGQYDSAERAFVQAAEEAARLPEGKASNLWAQAGNAAFAAQNYAAARSHFDAALLAGPVGNLATGLILSDRARAAVAAGDLAAGRSDLDRAQALVADDPLVWLLSAALARRTGDLTRADADIAVAARLAPRDAAVALEAGAIAITRGDVAAARKSWESAVAVQPDSTDAATARTYLAQLDAGAMGDADTRTTGQQKAPDAPRR